MLRKVMEGSEVSQFSVSWWSEVSDDEYVDVGRIEGRSKSVQDKATDEVEVTSGTGKSDVRVMLSSICCIILISLGIFWHIFFSSSVLLIWVILFLQIMSRRSHSRIDSSREKPILCTWKGRGRCCGISRGVINLINRDWIRRDRGFMVLPILVMTGC